MGYYRFPTFSIHGSCLYDFSLINFNKMTRTLFYDLLPNLLNLRERCIFPFIDPYLGCPANSRIRWLPCDGCDTFHELIPLFPEQADGFRQRCFDDLMVNRLEDLPSRMTCFTFDRGEVVWSTFAPLVAAFPAMPTPFAGGAIDAINIPPANSRSPNDRRSPMTGSYSPNMCCKSYQPIRSKWNSFMLSDDVWSA